MAGSMRRPVCPEIRTFEVLHKTKGVVSTGEAIDIVRIPMESELQEEWQVEYKEGSRKKGKALPAPSVVKNVGGVAEKYSETTIPGLYTEIIKTRGKTIKDQKLCISLMKRDGATGENLRVVQLETRSELPDISDQHWPHIHFGEKYEKFELESARSLDFERSIEYFEHRSNVKFKTIPEDPYNPSSFKMK